MTTEMKIQVALDLTSISQALFIAQKIVKGSKRRDFIILEIGTPLIKSEGIRSVRIFREQFEDITLVADMKTIDTGKLEAEIAFNNGADYTSVLALANNETILSVVDTAKEHRKGVIIDFIALSKNDLYIRVKDLMKLLENNYKNYFSKIVFCLHTAIDIQEKYDKKTIFTEIFKMLRKSYPHPLIAVAGGIKPITARYYADIGADIIVVGGYITKSEDPTAAFENILKSVGI